MRLRERHIPRRPIIEAVSTFEIIESYPDDKYLPSYLVYFKYQETAYHALFAVDVENTNVRIVTAYRPSPERWEEDFRRRKKP